jgi:hypothetical protein
MEMRIYNPKIGLTTLIARIGTTARWLVWRIADPDTAESGRCGHSK